MFSRIILFLTIFLSTLESQGQTWRSEPYPVDIISPLSKTYLSFDITEKGMMNHVTELLAEGWIVHDTMILAEDSLRYFYRYHFNSFNPFGIQADSVYLIFRNTRVLWQMEADTLFYATVVAVINNENRILEVQKTYSQLRKKLAAKFDHSNHRKNRKKDKHPYETSSMIRKGYYLSPMAFGWYEKNDTLYLYINFRIPIRTVSPD